MIFIRQKQLQVEKEVVQLKSIYSKRQERILILILMTKVVNELTRLGLPLFWGPDTDFWPMTCEVEA